MTVEIVSACGPGFLAGTSARSVTETARIDPRQLSFTYACNIVLDGYPKALAARTRKQQGRELDRIIDLVAGCRLLKRTKRRSNPRAVWGRGYRFPIRRREENRVSAPQFSGRRERP